MDNFNTPKVVALGFFDGVHLGHQAILGTAAGLAAEKGLESAAITFERHPRSLVRGRAPQLITTAARRQALMLAQGVGRVIALPFDEKTADTAPEDFARTLMETFGAVQVVCGESYRFGKNAAGTPDLLREIGLAVHICPKVQDEHGATISSTAVRGLIREGEMAQACLYLGRPFALEGEVIHGQQMGRRLGFPTLNLAPADDIVLPRRGVYSGAVRLESGQTFPALTNVGTRPTFSSADIVSVESHIPGFRGDLYGTGVAVQLLRFLRPERAFETPEALRAQIAEDFREALGREIL